MADAETFDLANHAVPSEPRSGRRTTAARKPAPPLTLPADLGDAMGFRLRRASATADALFAETFGALDINAAHYAILMVVRANPGSQTSAVGSLLGITPNNMVPLLDSLAARGFLQRSLSVTDRRVRHLRLTPRGQELCLEVADRHQLLQAKIEASMGKEEAAELLRLLISYSSCGSSLDK